MNLPKKFVQMRLIIHCKNFEPFNFLVEYVGGDLLHSKPWISARSVWSRNNQFLCTLYQTQGSLDCLLKQHLRKRMKAISCRQSYFNDFCKGLLTCSLHSAHTVTILKPTRLEIEKKFDVCIELRFQENFSHICFEDYVWGRGVNWIMSSSLLPRVS